MKLIVRPSAEEDIIRQVEWYAEQNLPDIALRFNAAVQRSIEALTTAPLAGAPKTFAAATLASLRTWPVKSFADLKIYYLADAQSITVLRILHGKRDLAAILTSGNP